MATPDDTPFPTSAAATAAGIASPQAPAGAGTGTGAAGNEMLQRVVQGAHQTIDRLAETAAPHVQRISEGVSTGTGQVREMGEEWTESLRSTVREHPLAALATALAVGLLIARITR